MKDIRNQNLTFFAKKVPMKFTTNYNIQNVYSKNIVYRKDLSFYEYLYIKGFILTNHTDNFMDFKDGVVIFAKKMFEIIISNNQFAFLPYLQEVNKIFEGTNFDDFSKGKDENDAMDTIIAHYLRRSEYLKRYNYRNNKKYTGKIGFARFMFKFLYFQDFTRLTELCTEYASIIKPNFGEIDREEKCQQDLRFLTNFVKKEDKDMFFSKEVLRQRLNKYKLSSD